MENYEKKSKEQIAVELNSWSEAKREEWLDFLDEAGLTPEYTKLFSDALASVRTFTPLDASQEDGKKVVLSAFRTVLVNIRNTKLEETRRQIYRNARTGEKIEASQEDLDAAHFFNLVLDQTFSEEKL